VTERDIYTNVNLLVETYAHLCTGWVAFVRSGKAFLRGVFQPKRFLCTASPIFRNSFTFGTEMLYVLVEYYLFVHLTQGCTNIWRQFTSKPKFCSVAANIFKPRVWNLLRTTELSFGILRWFLHFRRFYAPLIYTKLSVAHTLQLQGVGWLMDTEVERTWEEALLS
jgi:hypothetical protein